PIEILMADRVQVGIGSRIHEIDRIWSVVTNGKLDRIHVVPECVAKRQRVVMHAFEKARSSCGTRGDVTLMMGLPRIVTHDVNPGTAQHVAAIVVCEFDTFLRHHRQVASLIVSREKSITVIATVNVLPPAAVSRLKKDWETEIIEYLVPFDEF